MVPEAAVTLTSLSFGAGDQGRFISLTLHFSTPWRGDWGRLYRQNLKEPLDFHFFASLTPAQNSTELPQATTVPLTLPCVQMREEGCEAAVARPRHHCYCRMGEKNPPQAHNPYARAIHDPTLSFLQPNPIFKPWDLVFPCKSLTGQTLFQPQRLPLRSCDLALEASSPPKKPLLASPASRMVELGT